MSVVNFFSVNATRCCNETVSYSNLRINSDEIKKELLTQAKKITINHA